MFKKMSMCRKISLMIVIILVVAMFGSKVRASEGDIWLTPINQNVGTSTGFDAEVHIDTGGKNLGGFNLYFDFDATNITIDTTQGAEGVDKGTDGSNYILTINSTDIANGHLRFAGIASSGYANGNDVHIATIHAETTSGFTSGTTSLSLRVNELLDENSTAFSSGTITGATITYPVSDTTPPTLAEITSVSTPTSDTTPNYTFSSTEAGTITYGGSCNSSTTQATIGNNTITFNTLSDGTYSNCTIVVTDASSNASSTLNITSFVVDTSIPDTTSPAMSNGSPSGSLSSDTTQTVLTLTTDENATCRYSTSANVTYSSMSKNFSTTGGTTQQVLVTGLTAGNSYNFYIRCSDGNNNMSTSNYRINFSVSSVAEDNDNDTNAIVIANSSDQVNIETPKVKADKKGDSAKLSKSKRVYSREQKIKFKGETDGLIGGKVQIYVDKKLKYTIDLKSDGSWNKKVKMKKDGKHTIRFKYLDKNNNIIKESKKYTVKIDTKKPKFKKMLSFLNKHRGDKIWWKATDNNKVKYYKYYFNGKKKETKRASFIVPSNTSRGLHTLKIKAYDKAGNRAIKYVIINVK